jgi:Transcriptional regulatory protein, C terminal
MLGGASVRAILRRFHAGRAAQTMSIDRGGFRFAGWQLDRRARRLVDPSGTPVPLTKGEYSLLLAFLDSPERPLSREQLLQATRAQEDVFDRSIDVQILRLRRKLEQDASAPRFIRTERGVGYGPLMTRIGLACDNLISAEVVLADGEVLICDAGRNADLFWALRGGGGNFGVLTSARVRLHELGPVLAGNIVFPWPDARAAFRRFADLMLRAPLELSGAAVLSAGPGGKPVVVISLIWMGDRARGEAIIAECAAAGTPLLAKVGPMPASELLALTNGKLAQGHGYEVATRWLATLAPEVIDVMVSPIRSPQTRICGPLMNPLDSGLA